MTGRRSIVWLARSAIVAFSVTLAFVGCSRQGEGERCNRQAAGHEDCDQGLFCIRCVDLANGSVDCCCPPGAGSSGNCERADPPRVSSPTVCPDEGATGATGGTNGTGGASGASGSGNASGMGGTGGSGGSGNASGSGGASGGSAGASGTGGESGAPDAAGAGGV